MPEEERYTQSAPGMLKAWDIAKKKKQQSSRQRGYKTTRDFQQERKKRKGTLRKGESIADFAARTASTVEDVINANTHIRTFRTGLKLNLPSYNVLGGAEKLGVQAPRYNVLGGARTGRRPSLFNPPNRGVAMRKAEDLGLPEPARISYDASGRPTTRPRTPLWTAPSPALALGQERRRRFGPQPPTSPGQGVGSAYGFTPSGTAGTAGAVTGTAEPPAPALSPADLTGFVRENNLGGERFAGPRGTVALRAQQFARGEFPEMLNAMDVKYLTDPRMVGGALDMALIAANYEQDRWGNWVLKEGIAEPGGGGGAGGYGNGFGNYYGYGGYGGGGYGSPRRGGGAGFYPGETYSPITGATIGKSGRVYDATEFGPISWRI